MRPALFLLCILALLYSIPGIAQTGIYVNEAMGSNRTTIADSTGSFEDWLELYNANNISKPLNGYYVTNDVSNPQLFRLSGNLQIPARGYLLLWASKDTTRGKTHLPFKISASGENLYLFAPDGQTLVDSLILGQQKTDVSYGRIKDGSSTLCFFANPSPRVTNNNSAGYSGILNPPVFSQPAGFYGAAFSLTITSDDPAAKIVYTTDGSNPDASNINGTVYRYKNIYQRNPTDTAGPFLLDSFRSFNYVNPFTVKDASANPNKISIKSSTTENSYSYAPATLINKGTVVRAVATKAGYIPSEITTATYFVTTGGTNKYTLPVLSISVPENDLYSWDSGIYNAGTDFEKWRKLNPTATANGGTPANWTRDTEFPASFELFAPNATTRQLQTGVGLAINGNYTRGSGQKAFRIYFRNSYGASNLDYQIFSDLLYKDYERLVLSNGGNDMSNAHMRDMVAQACVKHLNFGSQHQQPAVAFVNGEFWGYLNIRQRYDDNHFKQVWGIDPDSLDYIENQSTVNYGTGTANTNLRNFIKANDMSLTANYQNAQTQMDMDNFIDYQIAEIFFGNTDWPSNNLSYFRKRVPYTPGAPPGHDGRFRWTINDLDRAFGFSSSVSHNTLAWATGTSTSANPSAWSTEMLRKLLANAEFKTKFITRYADLLNTTFLSANLDAVINSYRTILSPHIAEHTQRWRHPGSASSWNAYVNGLISYSDQRPAYARQHIRGQFALGTESQLTINVSDTTQGFITVNTIDITPAFPGVPKNAYPWVGLYYQEVPVTLVAKPKQGYRFVSWTGDSTSTKDTLIVALSSNKSYTALFQSLPVTDTGKVITYWHFNNLLSGTLSSINADTSLTGNATITYPGTGAGVLNRSPSAEGSLVNAQFNQPVGYSLRANNPAIPRSLLISTPTTGYKNIVLRYATVRTGSGPDYQRVYYTNDVTSANVVWTLKADSIVVPSPQTNPFGLQKLDFSADANTANNSKFGVKIEFFGPNASATSTSGNARFDNITVNGIPLSNQDYPTIAVSADRTNVCATSKVIFTAKTTNAGASPVFQWIKNNTNVGTSQSSFADSSFQNGDFVYCKLTVNDSTFASNKVFITVVSSNLTVTGLTKNAPSACGNNDGDITINRSGGTSPFQYSLNGVNYFTSNSFTNLGAGTYTAYVKDSKGCVASLTDELVKIPTLTVSVNKTSPSACGGNDGSIIVNKSGGNPPYTYSLNGVNYGPSNVFNNLGAGAYTAYVKDADDCIASVNAPLANASALVISGLTTTAPSGCTSADGSITINNSGGTAPYKYSLDGVNYVPNNVFNNLTAGNYTAYVKDAGNCVAQMAGVLSNNSTFAITGLTITATTACNKNDGSLTINATGGTMPFQYSINGMSYGSANVFNNLAAGSYTAYVTDAGGCAVTLSGVVEKFSSDLDILALDQKSAAACRNDGGIDIVEEGGYSPFLYKLNNGEYVGESSFGNLAAGTYTTYVMDAKGCVDSVNTVLDKIAPIVPSLDKTPASACTDDGIITVNGSGGTQPYQYSLDNVTYSREKVFYGLPAGSYTAYVKDADGCIASTSDVLARIPLVVTASTTPASACRGDGAITIGGSGGALAYQYSLNGVDYVLTNTFSNLAAGPYTAYIKDANGCVASLGATVSKATPLGISLIKTSASACANTGSITVNGSGGTSPYQYSLDNVTYVSTNVFNNLAAGTYTADIKDARGCIVSLTDVLGSTPAPVITSLTTTSASACNTGGAITINKSGGVSPFTYSLDNVNYFNSNQFTNLASGTYTAYVKDGNGCIGSLTGTVSKVASVVVSLSKTDPSACANNGAITVSKTGGTSPFTYSLDGVTYVSSNVFNNLAGGTYTAYVKDAKGCVASASVTLAKPAPLGIAGFAITSVAACKNDGAITVHKTGGTSPYKYSLDGVNYVANNVFTNLGAGTYTAYIKDYRGCTASATTVLTKASPLTISLSKTDPSACADNGSISINRSGGTYPYQYSLDGVNYSTNKVFSNLAAGTYTGYVKDARGCVVSVSGALTKPAALVITSVTKTNPTACSANGKLTVNRAGGTSPFTYSLDGVTYVTSNVFSNLAANTYTAYVKDARGCVAKLTGIVLTAPVCTTALSAGQKSISPSAAFSLQVLPNPSTTQFSLRVESADDREVDVTVSDLLGRKRITARTAPNSVFVFGKNLAAGMYIVEVSQGAKTAALKVVKVE